MPVTTRCPLAARTASTAASKSGPSRSARDRTAPASILRISRPLSRFMKKASIPGLTLPGKSPIIKARSMRKRKGGYAPPYSKHSYLVHGKFMTSKWDFEHHVVPPISSSSTFRLETAERGAAGFCGYCDPKDRGHRRSDIFIYDRLDEPTQAMLEERLAFVEGGDIAVAFSTGMAAIAAALGITLKAGDEVVA